MKKLVLYILLSVSTSVCVFGEIIRYSQDFCNSAMLLAEVKYRKDLNKFVYNDDINKIVPLNGNIEVYALSGKSAYCICYPVIKENETDPVVGKQYALYQLYGIDKSFKNYIKNTLMIKPISEDECYLLNQQIKEEMWNKAEQLNDSIKHVEDSIKYINSKEYKDSIAIETMKQTYCETHTINQLDDYFVKDIMGNSFYISPTSCVAYNDNCFYMLDENGYLRVFNVNVANGKKMKCSFDCHINCFGDSLQNYFNAHPELANMVEYNTKVRSDKIDKEEKELAELQASIRKDHPYIMLTDYGFSLNSVDGVEPYFEALVTGTKAVKYIHYYFKIFNSVGDECLVRYQDSNICQVTVVGPVEPFEDADCRFDKATHYLYSSAASKMKVVRIKLEYMDGTSKTITSGF